MLAVETETRSKRQQIAEQRFEAYEAWQREQAPVLLAREVLDPNGFMYRRATELVTERRQMPAEQTADYDPSSDLLGSARIVAAAEEAGYDTSDARANNRQNIRTFFTESLLNGGHVSEVETAINQRGEAVVSDIPHWELFLRGANKGMVEVRSAEIAEEFYAAALYNRPELRDKHDLFIISPSREDTAGNTLMIRRVRHEATPYGNKRQTQQLYYKNSNTSDATSMLRELGVYTSSKELDAIEILNTPLLLRRDAFEYGVVDLGEMLDTITAERIDQPVFCGVPLDKPVERRRYFDLPAISCAREQNIDQHITSIEQATLELVTSQTLSFIEENQRFSKLFIEALRKICQDHPEYAEAAFGESSTKDYWEAYHARARGDYAAAQEALERAHSKSNSVSACEITISISSEIGKSEASPRASLQEKYGFDKLQKGQCVACKQGSKNQLLGPCGFCNDCDTKDRLHPGYIKELVNQKARQEQETKFVSIAIETMPKTISKPLRSGYYKVGGEMLYFEQQIRIGATMPVFKRVDGEEITGDAAQNLYEELKISYAVA